MFCLENANIKVFSTLFVEFTCFEDSTLFFPSGNVGVFVIIPEPVCSRQMSSCNGTLSGSYPIGEHTIQCNCTDGTESVDTCDISFEVGKNVCKQILDNHNLNTQFYFCYVEEEPTVFLLVSLS